MRILWSGFVKEIKSFYITEDKDELRVEYWENYYEADKNGASEFFIDKTCFKNGEKDFKAFIEIVQQSLLKKGFFDFDQDDYSKLIKKGGKQ